MNTCENCGSRVYSLGCTWCDEENYIEEQEFLNDLEPVYEPPSNRIARFADAVPVPEKGQ